MNTHMNTKVAGAVKSKMKADGLSQQALADRLGMKRTNLVRMLGGHVGSVPRRWQEVLDELGLELIAVPKEEENQDG